MSTATSCAASARTLPRTVRVGNAPSLLLRHLAFGVADLSAERLRRIVDAGFVLNVFEVPSISRKDAHTILRDGSQSAADQAKRLISGYDYTLAAGIITALCGASPSARAPLCETRNRGPYLATYGRALTNLDALPRPFVIADLSPIHEDAFPAVADTMLRQIRTADITEANRIVTTQQRLLSLFLAGVALERPLQQSLAEFIHLVR